MKKTFMLICLALATLSVSATATAADWNYAGAAYTTSDLKDRSGDGFKVEASKSLGSVLFAQAGYRNGFDSDLKAGTASFALGAHKNIAGLDTYVLARAGAIVDDRLDADKWSYEAEAGVRTNVTDRMELRGGVVAANLRGANSFDNVRYYGKVGAEYALTKNLRLGADVLAKNGVTEGQVGVRLYF